MSSSGSTVPIDRLASGYLANATAPRVNTDLTLRAQLEDAYPGQHITVAPEAGCDVLAFAAATGSAIVAPDPDGNGTRRGPLETLRYLPPRVRRIAAASSSAPPCPAEGGDGDAAAEEEAAGQGALGAEVLFGRYRVGFAGHEMVLYLVDGRDGSGYYPTVRSYYIVSDRAEHARALLLAAGAYWSRLHGEIWVFDQGFWNRDRELWESMRGARWEDVILDPDMKKGIIGDVNRFFDGREAYNRLKVPWKRGIIFHGPPGNGKTISIKATMHMLYERPEEVPTLYVKTLASYAGPEYSLNTIFTKARQEAPCYLVFEDLDSLVSDNVRSFFLNQVDGIAKNDGILMVGSTNHLDRLDPGISKRPSRFDRKYFFPNPNFEERLQYCEFWRRKVLGPDAEVVPLRDDKIEFPRALCTAAAKITDGFSFAYIQEAFLASLLVIASEAAVEVDQELEFDLLDDAADSGSDAEDDDDLEKVTLWVEFRKQVKILREDMDSSGINTDMSNLKIGR